MNEQFFHIHHSLFDAIILRQGAQLIHFQPKYGEPLLWSSALSTFEKGKPFRGGIPICWPWFARRGVPSHGFARIMEWTLQTFQESEKGVHLVFELNDSDATREIWPHAFHARLEMNLGQAVNIALHVKSHQETTGALHSYFTCKNIHDIIISGLGDSYQDALQAEKLCVSADEVLHVNGAIDRIYTKPEAQTRLIEPERTVLISHTNHSDVVIWNPWKEGSETLRDMQEDDYQKMVCIESARIFKPMKGEDSLQVKITLLDSRMSCIEG